MALNSPIIPAPGQNCSFLLCPGVWTGKGIGVEEEFLGSLLPVDGSLFHALIPEVSAQVTRGYNLSHTHPEMREEPLLEGEPRP